MRLLSIRAEVLSKRIPPLRLGSFSPPTTSYGREAPPSPSGRFPLNILVKIGVKKALEFLRDGLYFGSRFLYEGG